MGWHQKQAGRIESHNINGIYVPDHAAKRATAYQCDDWPTESNVAAGMFPDKGVLIIDELGNCPVQSVSLLLNLLNEHELGSERIHPGWVIACTSNRLSDKSGIRALFMSEINRLMVLEVSTPYEAWEAVANTVGVRRDILSYFRGNPEELNECDILEADPKNPNGQMRRKSIPPNTQFTSPRSVTKLSAFLDGWQAVNGPDSLPPLAMFAGFVGWSIADKLMQWCIYSPSLVGWSEIVRDPIKARLPLDKNGDMSLGALYNVSLQMASKVDKATAPAFFTYIKRVSDQVGDDFAESTIALVERRDAKLKEEERKKGNPNPRGTGFCESTAYLQHIARRDAP